MGSIGKSSSGSIIIQNSNPNVTPEEVYEQTKRFILETGNIPTDQEITINKIPTENDKAVLRAIGEFGELTPVESNVNNLSFRLNGALQYLHPGVGAFDSRGGTIYVQDRNGTYLESNSKEINGAGMYLAHSYVERRNRERQ